MSATALVVDATCDLPRSYLESHQIYVLPVEIQSENGKFIDCRDMKTTLDFYNQVLKKGAKATTSPPSIESITALLRNELVTPYDAVQVITMHSDRSDIFKNVREASYINKDRIQQWRREADLDPKFRLRILDSSSMATGVGLMVHEAVRLLKEKAYSIDKLKKPLELYKQHIDTLVVANQLEYLRNDTANKTGSSIGWMNYQMGKMLGVKPVLRCYRGEFSAPFREKGFDNALAKALKAVRRQIELGLEQPIVNTSYAGNLAEIRANPEFNRFVTFAKQHKVKVLLSMMSAAAAVNIGPGTFSISYASATIPQGL